MKTKKLLDKNGNPIQIEQGQVRGLKEALANVGSGASGKEVITADENFYGSIYDRENTEQGSLYLDFINVDLDNKYIVVDLEQYYQDMPHAQGIEIFFSNKSIKNSTIIINMPNCLPYTIQEKTCYFNFIDGGAILFDMATEQARGNVFDIDSYSNLNYGDYIEFGFGITSQVGQYQVKIDFNENGFANCIMYLFTEI